MSSPSLLRLGMSRRGVLKGIGGMSAILFMPTSRSFASLPLTDMERFLKTTSVLTGITLDKSYIQLGNRIWYALTHNATAGELKNWMRLIDQVAALPLGTGEKRINQTLLRMGPGYVKKARLTAKVWYTGRIKITSGPRKGEIDVIDYDDALVWQACTFTKPPVTCGGHFGYWQHPYTGGAANVKSY